MPKPNLVPADSNGRTGVKKEGNSGELDAISEEIESSKGKSDPKRSGLLTRTCFFAVLLSPILEALRQIVYSHFVDIYQLSFNALSLLPMDAAI